MKLIDLHAERIAALEAARAAIDREIALLTSDGNRPEAVVAHTPQWLGLAQAAHRCGCHPETMARRARAHGLGRRVGNAWMIDWNRVAAWLEARPFVPLPQDDVSDIVDQCGTKSDAADDPPAVS